MPDAFAIFNLRRQPWLEEEVLREAFHRRSAVVHPDAGGAAADFAELNGAYQILREPVSRVRLLLELEAPELLTGSPQIGSALGERFMVVALVRQKAEGFLSGYRSGSLLGRALLAGERLENVQSLETALAGLEVERERALGEVRGMNATWRERMVRLGELYAELSFLNKWGAQLRETRLQLELAR